MEIEWHVRPSPHVEHTHTQSMYFVNCVTQKSKSLIDMNSILDKNKLLYAQSVRRMTVVWLICLFVCLWVCECLFVCSFRRPSQTYENWIESWIYHAMRISNALYRVICRSFARSLACYRLSLFSMRFACFRWEWFMSLICSAWHHIFCAAVGCRSPAADGYCCWWWLWLLFCHCADVYHQISSIQLRTAKEMIVIHKPLYNVYI